MKLFFLRHGLAGDRSEWKGNDATRPLTDNGVEKMQRTAATLAQLDLELDAIITSPLVRGRPRRLSRSNWAWIQSWSRTHGLRPVLMSNNCTLFCSIIRMRTR